MIAHHSGALLVIGVAGSGRTEALARRLALLSESGEGALALTSSQAGAADLRSRAEEAAEGPFEEMAIHPYRAAAMRLLREHSTEAGLDPFLEFLSPAERLAMLLERVDELPLRRHEIRGNVAGLLARLVGRIDALKAAGIGPERFRGWTDELDPRRGRGRRRRLGRARARVRRASTSSTTRSCTRPARWTGARP